MVDDKHGMRSALDAFHDIVSFFGGFRNIMKYKLVLALMTAMLTFSVTACGSSTGGTESTGTEVTQEKAGGADVSVKGVVSAEVTTQPTKTEYHVGEEFDGAGGVVTVTLENGKTQDIPMDSADITTNLNTEKVGKKSVSVYYGDIKASKTVNVVVTKESLSVKVNYNCDEKADEEYEIDKGAVVVEPEVPDRGDSYQFAGWFTDEACTTAYDFSKPADGSVEIFAKWVDLSEGAYRFSFVYNYDGAPSEDYHTFNENGKAMTKIEDPERNGYQFDGWFTEADGGDEFDFSQALETDTSVYAHWTKTVSGVNEWVFEVENVDLSTKTGAGLSGTTSKGGMLVTDSSKGASNGVYLSYQYITGNQIEFVLCSDEEVSDVKLVARLSQEARDYTYDSSNYTIALNGESINYDSIKFTGVPGFTADGAEPVEFADYTIGTNLTLKKGRNTITFTVANADALQGTTMNAASPLLDCIKLSTSAVVIWDGSAGLPMNW